MQQTVQDRLLGALGATLVIVLIGYLLLFGLPVTSHILRDPAITVVDIQPPPVRRPPPFVRPPRHTKATSTPSTRNLKNKASAIVAPPPVLPPPPTPIAAALQPDLGVAASSGTSDLSGPGEGAGGKGDGTGAGGDGDDGADDIPPRQIGGRFRYSDLSASIRDGGIGGSVSVRYEVEADGRVDNCIVTVSSGNAELDYWTCRLIEQRFRYSPSRTPDGEPVASFLEEHHRWTNDRQPLARPFR